MEPKASKRRKFTPPQIAEMWGSSSEKVLTLIRNGELKAINLATNVNGRRRYAVDQDDLAAFERSREIVPSKRVPPPKLRKLPSSAARVKEFF